VVDLEELIVVCCFLGCDWILLQFEKLSNQETIEFCGNSVNSFDCELLKGLIQLIHNTGLMIFRALTHFSPS